MTAPREDLTGRVFGSWMVLRFSHRADNRAALWACRCACGTEKAVRASDLARGRSARCRDCAKVAPGPHGRTLYKVWHSMRQRCENPKHKNWDHYGARGIKVCERWQRFANFYADMMPSYEPGLTVERSDVDGPYSLENCTWATRTEQGRNKRNNRRITFLGETKALVEWAEQVGLNYSVVQNRLNKLGWPVERALTVGADPAALACLAESTGTEHVCRICDPARYGGEDR